MFGTKLISIRNLHAIRRFSAQSSQFVKIVEVGPRDGLQNEPKVVPPAIKIEFINKLSQTGLKTIEVTSYVSPKWIPQLADNNTVFKGIEKQPNISYPVLIPNLKGLTEAIKVGVKEIAVFASASEGFARKNTNCSIAESLQRIGEVTTEAKKQGIKIRGYVSCVVGCPYDGEVAPKTVATITEKLLDLGCYEISLGDTIGVGTKNKISHMIKEQLRVVSADQLAIHCHDTYGQALVNVCTALDLGLKVVDSSVSGLGGCPYAKGATGNVATEDLVYMLHGMGVETGVDLMKLVDVGNFISGIIGKPTASKVNAVLYRNLETKSVA